MADKMKITYADGSVFEGTAGELVADLNKRLKANDGHPIMLQVAKAKSY